MLTTLCETSFETLSAKNFCINRALLRCLKAVQTVPKRYKLQLNTKNKKDSNQGFTFSRTVLEASILNAGWSSPVARQAHNLKVVSSNLAPATK
jgi:hypothetical protein